MSDGKLVKWSSTRKLIETSRYGESDIADMKLDIDSLQTIGNLKHFGGVLAYDKRWLVFDFDTASRKALKVKKYTSIYFNGVVFRPGTEDPDTGELIEGDYVKDLESDMAASVTAAGLSTMNGLDFYVYLVPDGSARGGDIVASLRTDAPSDIDASYTASNTLRIGCFHTLCANVGTIDGDLSVQSTANNAFKSVGHASVAVNDMFCRKNYSQTRDPDFHNFYNKQVIRVNSNSYYDIIQQAHPLSGWLAGQILPESVFCLTWHMKGDRHVKGLVYEPDSRIVAGIYLQSGTGRATASAYGGTNTRSRQQVNHKQDMADIGMRLLSDYEFSLAAQGSNEKTSVYGSSEANSTTTGGSVDTQSRRMVSDIGCEDCCGKIHQWLSDVAGIGGSGWGTSDGNGGLGNQYGSVQGLIA